MMTTDDPIEVSETRQSTRYIGLEPIRATFGPLAVAVHDLCEGGFQISHDESLKIGSSAGLIFENPTNFETLSFRCRVVWSKLSSSATPRNKPSYRSGVRIESSGDGSREALQRLISHFGRPDDASMARKRSKVLEVARRRAAPPVMKASNPVPIADQLRSEIVRARAKVRSNPADSARFYRIARASLSLKELQTLQSNNGESLEDVLAVWEILGRRIPLTVVARVIHSSGSNAG